MWIDAGMNGIFDRKKYGKRGQQLLATYEYVMHVVSERTSDLWSSIFVSLLHTHSVTYVKQWETGEIMNYLVTCMLTYC